MVELLLHYLYTNYVDVIGSIIGLIYLYLEFTAKKSMWIASIIMAVFYIIILYRSNLYAMSIIYMYFFAASIHGWLRWNQHTKIIIIRMPQKETPTITSLTLIAAAIIYLLLTLLTTTNQFVVLGDAIVTALSIVALWMASKCWAEQWCLLIPANLFTALLMFAQNEYASSLMFLIYFVVSIFGYLHWLKLAKLSVPISSFTLNQTDQNTSNER